MNGATYVAGVKGLQPTTGKEDEVHWCEGKSKENVLRF